MRIKLVLITIFIITAGIFFSARIKNNFPSDLRDAMGEFSTDIDRLTNEAENSQSPELPSPPEAPPVIGPGAISADKSSDADLPQAQSCFLVVRDDTGFESGGCSATIIGRNTAITAAHCGPPEYSKFSRTLYCGVDQQKYTGKLTVASGFDFSESKVTAQLIAKDYAIITLDKGQKFSAAPLPFAQKNQWAEFSDYDHNRCVVMGWGINNHGSYGRLYYAPVRELAYERTNPAVLRIGGTKDVNYIGHGDSGGTLTCLDNKGKWYIVGVLSAVKTTKSMHTMSMALSTIGWENWKDWK